jgi:hypothetical protein
VTRAIAAVLSAVVAIWALFYIDRIPIAEIAGTTRVVAQPGSTMLISGISSGNLMTLTFRAARRVRLTAGPGSRLFRPTPSDFTAAPPLPLGSPPRGQTVVDIFEAPHGSGNIDFIFHALGGGTGAITLDPIAPIGASRGFRLMARGGPIEINVLMAGATDGSGVGDMAVASGGKSVATDEASILLPAGVTIEVLIDGLAKPGAKPLVVEFPELPDKNAASLLRAGAVGVGDPAAGRFDILFCGAAPDRSLVLTPLVFPRPKVENCAAGALTLTRFDPLDGVGVDVAGRAFHRSAGKTKMWDGPATFLANKIVGKIFEWGLKLLLVSWAGWALLELWKELRRRV